MFDIMLFGGRVLFAALLAVLLIAVMRTGVGLVSGQRAGDREWSLVVEKGPASIRGLVIPVRGPVIVGRSASSDIVVADNCVSARHARFQLHDDVLTVEDLGSTNGTQLNRDYILSRTQLHDGDKVTVGDTTIRARHA